MGCNYVGDLSDGFIFQPIAFEFQGAAGPNTNFSEKAL